MRTIKLLLLLLTKCTQPVDIIGYSCDVANHTDTRYTEIDITDNSDDCEGSESDFSLQGTNLTTQIVHQLDFIEIPTINCQLEISLEAAPCGTDLIRSRIWNAEIIVHPEKYVMSRHECEHAHNHLTLNIQNEYNQFGDKAPATIVIPINKYQEEGSLYITGTTDVRYGWCTGEQFNVRRQSFPKHLLKLNYNININEVTGRFYHTSKTLVLPTDSSIHLRTNNIDQGVTKDTKHGTYVFTVPSITAKYEEVNHGVGNLYYKRDNSSAIMTLTLVDQNKFAIMLLDTTTICIGDICTQAHKTLLPGIYVIIYMQKPMIELENAAVTELSFYTETRAQMHSSFIILNMNLHDNLQKISNAFCKITNQITSLHPKETTINLVHDYTNSLVNRDPINVLSRGSVLYLMSCHKMNLTLSPDETHCYNDVPVIHPSTGTRIFLDPKTYITKSISSKSSCSSIFPMKYKLLNPDMTKSWYCFNPAISNQKSCFPPSKNSIASLINHKLDFKFLDTSMYPKSELDKINTIILEDSIFPDEGVSHQNTIRSSTIMTGPYRYSWINGQFQRALNEQDIMEALTPEFITRLNALRKAAPDILVFILLIRFLLCLRICNNDLLKSPLLAITTLLKIILLLPTDSNDTNQNPSELREIFRSFKEREERLLLLLDKLDTVKS